jgi:transcriptional regulator with XRE-family HTH domain
MENNPSLSELIQRTRKQQGLSREALAGLAQVSTTFIRDAEKDVAQCSFGKLMHLLGALGLQWKVSGAQQ